MTDYANWEALTAAAQKKCEGILQRDVAPVAAEILRKHILSDIYGAYTPKQNGWVGGSTYQRRFVLPNTLTYYPIGQVLILYCFKLLNWSISILISIPAGVIIRNRMKKSGLICRKKTKEAIS